MTIKVMSFNIRYGLADDGENRWEKRKSRVIDRIRAFSPDLIGLQECRDDFQADFLKTSLPDYHFYGVRREGGGDTALEMAPVLFLKSSFELVEEGCFWLSDTPGAPGSNSWESLFARTATWAELVHKPSGQALLFLNTHFDLIQSAIDGSARLLQQWSGEKVKTRRVIVTGDFNADKNSHAYRKMTVHLMDAYKKIHPNGTDETTFHSFGQPESASSIDWVLVSHHFCVSSATIDRTHNGPLYPSDHYPVLVTLD